MKNFKTIITVIAISLSTVFSAAATEKSPTETKNDLRTTIVSLLGDKISLKIKQDCNVKVLFMVNNKNELVVISVDSKESEFNTYVKNKLNYKKVDVAGVKKGEVYKVPIKVNKSI